MFDDFECFFGSIWILIYLLCCYGVEGVGYCDDLCYEWNVFVGEIVWVVLFVLVFVMLMNGW